MSARISLVVCTLNEEANIAGCILSAKGLADEVVIVDMHSDDKTAEIARAHGAAVHLVERKPFVDPTRNYAISLATGDWILMIDADERVEAGLIGVLRDIALNDSADAVKLFSRTFMFGKHIRYTGWQDGYYYRFFKKGFMRYADVEVHMRPIVDGRLVTIDEQVGAVAHYNYRDFSHFITKLNTYTDGEALKLVRAGGRLTPLRGAYWGIYNFYKRYVLLRGYKDGIYGFVISAFIGFYWFLAFCKAWEKLKGRADGVIPASDRSSI